MTRSRGYGSSPVIAGPAVTAPDMMEEQGTRRWPGAPDRSARVFAGRSDQVALARDFVRHALGHVPVLDEVVLLVSELCTNALQHTASGHGGTFEVVVLRGLCSVLVEVRDDGSVQIPAVHPADVLSEAGRGLSLLGLADEWGHRGGHQGRSVFFRLSWAEPA
jgi:serine/threonine-protein kinase RsbW